jgi:23S rRNA (cytosine1962-C5)-methyltransferase
MPPGAIHAAPLGAAPSAARIRQSDAVSSGSLTRLIAFEDEHLLVVRKPPGINTHASGPHASEGIYEWLRRREPRWARLAILQRLDKETSGILIFALSAPAKASLSKQFSQRRVTKEYIFLTDRQPVREQWEVHSWIRKGRGRFESLPRPVEGGLEAETRFSVENAVDGHWSVVAQPITGRTHQIRLHAADSGIPILGDPLYGGTAMERLCLHARRLALRHPASNEPLELLDAPRFDEPPAMALKAAVIEAGETDAYRLIHGAPDGRAGWYIDCLDGFLLAASAAEAPAEAPDWLIAMTRHAGAAGVYLRGLDRYVRGAAPAESSPVPWWGALAGGEFVVRENGLRFLVSFSEGYSTGLFLDQRDNRRRLLVNWIGPDFPARAEGLAGARILNLFAYTCGFSVAAAAAGATTTSVDLSRKYLDWGRRNFAANKIDASGHEFIRGDVFEWLRRLARRRCSYDVVLLDPPTFSQSRQSGVFRAESGYGDLVRAAAGVLRPGGVLFASSNAARVDPQAFTGIVRERLGLAGFTVERELFVPQPPDFPSNREEPGYLKTVWMRAGGGGAMTR